MFVKWSCGCKGIHLMPTLGEPESRDIVLFDCQINELTFDDSPSGLQHKDRFLLHYVDTVKLIDDLRKLLADGEKWRVFQKLLKED